MKLVTLGGDAMRRVSTSGEWRQDGGRGRTGRGRKGGGMDGSVVVGGVWSKMRWRRCQVRGASWDSLEYCVVDVDCFLEAGPIVCYCCR